MSDAQKKEIIKKRFGRYLLLDHLVDGGMAKICRARHLGEQADKIVAIKMIQSQYSSDEAFRTMFMDEIKVAFGLLHPNIAQTYDYGMDEGHLFTVMEYVDGKNLKQFLDKLREKKFVFPVEICLHIAAQACQALHYAHTLTDKLTGNAFKIIHRDISPHNLMITYDGAVKVIDFGIAKSSTNSEATQAGTIKGKLSYLAPEYLEGLELDGRYDMFALGITLWEMLCNRKLFKAENDLAVLKQIQACKVPVPSSINPNIPKQLDEIVLKALSRDRTKRFKDMDTFNRELVKFLYSNYQNFNPSDLSYFAKDLFQEEIKIDRERFFEFGKIDIRPFLDEIKSDNENKQGQTSTAVPTDLITQTQLKKRDVVEYELDDEILQEIETKKKARAAALSKSSSSSTPEGGENKPPAQSPTPSAPVTKLDLSTKKESTLNKPKSNSSTQMHTRVKTEGTYRTSYSRGSTSNDEFEEEKDDSSKKVLVAAVIAFAVVVGTQYENLAAYFGVRLNNTNLTNQVVVQSPTHKDTSSQVRNPASVLGSIAFKSFDKYRHKIYVNGVRQEVSLLGDVKVQLGDLSVRIEQPGLRHFVTTVHLTETTTSAEIKIPTDQPTESYGQLITSRSCTEGKLFFDLYGEKRVEDVPIREPLLFPTGVDGSNGIAPATYEVSFQKKGEEFQRKITFTVNYQDDSIDLCTLVNPQ